MAERGNEQKNFFKNLHTDQYKWNDFFLIPLIVTIVMMFVGQMGVLVISKILKYLCSWVSFSINILQ